MPITGICEVVYGVADMAGCARFWADYGLREVAAGVDGSRADRDSRVFAATDGSLITIAPIDSPALPPANFSGSGVRRTFLAVSDAASLTALAQRLGDAGALEQAGETEVLFTDIDGNPMGLRVFRPHPFVCRPDPVNAPGHIVRLNQHRKWRARAQPRKINHIVYWSDDYVRAYEWYRDTLGFRMTDHAKANGIFARADGAFEHHTLFWLTTGHPGKAGMKGYAHIAFALEDVDEVMVGANYMLDQGWSNERPFAASLNRHRISSALYYYFPCPAGGDAEYHADTDYLDDGWIPRVWEMQFGASMWGSQSPGFFGEKGISWDVALDYDGESLDAWRGPPSEWLERK